MRKSLQLFFVLSILLMWCVNILAQDASMFGLSPYMGGTEKGQPQYQGESPDANTGFGNDAIASPVNFLSMPIPAGTPFTTLNPNFSPGWLAGGDIDASGVYYGCSYIGQGQGNLVQVNLVTGVPTVIGPITGFTLFPTSLAYNAANNTWYFGDTDGATSRLYTLNVATGAATLVGQITGCAGLIGMAINCTGQAYGVDIVTDQLYSINLGTGAGTAIGPLGFDASYAQDCDFDAATNTMYLAAYNAGISQGEFRSVNLGTGGTTLITAWPGSEITGFAIDNPCGPPCPIGAPSNPNPPDGTTGVGLTGNTASWTNGTGTVDVELWFGPAANVVKVYDGPAITSFALPTLTYNTTYLWYVVCKDSTCGTQGPTWSFTTMQDPNLNQWCDDFANFNNWTIVGPAGLTNWATSTTSNAGGTPPELRFSWTPSFTGVSTIRSVSIPLLNNWAVDYSFNYYLDWYADPSGIVTFGITYDGGATQTILYQDNNPTGNVGPTIVSGSFTTPASGASNAQLQITYDGYSFNIDYIYWDNICLDWIIPVELTSFTANADYGVVELSWITATETNNQGFEVQRSSGGEFETIAFVEGHGTTTEVQAYSYIDRNVNLGSYSYRLKQVDFDGTYEYSNIIEVDVPAPAVFALDQNYPNPFNPSTKIAFRLAVDSKVSLKVFDVLGQEVATLVNTNMLAGGHSFDFDASSLNSGVYLYRIEAVGNDGTNFVDVKKMILTK